MSSRFTFTFHLQSPSEDRMGLRSCKKKKKNAVLVTSAAETNHTLYNHKTSLQTSDCVKMTTSQASGSFDRQPQRFHPCILNFSCEIPNMSVTLVHTYIFHPCALLHLMFIVSRYSLIVVDVRTLLVFTRVYSHQSWFHILVGLCGFRVCMRATNIKAFTKLSTFPHIEQTFRHDIRHSCD